MEHADITIIGGGAVGLAISAELSKHYKNLVLLERHFSFGQETSSRNSEVIHSSIYYYKGYLKGKLCLKAMESYMIYAQNIICLIKKPGN